MRNRIILLFFSTVFAWSQNSPLHPTPDREYDVHHTKIMIKVEIDSETVEGVVTHRISPFSTDFTTLSLDCEDMIVTKVTLGYTKPLEFDQSETKLKIFLDQTYSFEDTFSVSIAYHGTPTRGLYFVHPDSVYPEKHAQAWTQGEQMENHHWVPLYDYPNDRATFETYLTVKKPYVAVSNGELVSVKDRGQTRTYHWRENSPMVSYLISFAVGNYQKVSDSLGDLPVDYWVYPEHSREDALRSFGKTPQMIQVFSDITNYFYPYEKYDQILIEDFMWGGMENVTLTHQTDRTMHYETSRPDHTSDGLVAHELAHQWFGDLLTTRNWANIWLNEGITSFMELVWVEADKGVDEMEYYRYGELKGMYWAAEMDPRPMVYFDYDDANSLFNGNVYAKGAVVMNLLRDYLGYDAFYRGLQRYVHDHALSTVETVDLKKSFEDATGKNLYWFFNQWAYRKGIPEIEASYRYDRSNQRVIIKLKQTQNVEETSLFRLPMTLLVDDGKLHRKRVTLDALEDQFYLPSDSPPRMVIVDEGMVIPKKMTFKKSVNELIYQLNRAPHVLDRVWAADQLSKTYARKKVTDALVRSIETDPFWGVRKEATEAFAKLKPPRGAEILLALAHEEDSRVFRARLRALGNYKKNDKVKEFLVQVLETNSKEYVLRDAFNALVKAYPEEAKNWIDWAMEQKSHQDILLRAAISALGQDKNGENYQRLKALAEYGGTSWDSRPTAVYQLANFVDDHPELLDWFQDHLTDPNRRVRSICIRTIGNKGSRKHIAVLQDLDDPFNQKTIKEAVKKLKAGKKRRSQKVRFH